MTKKKAKDEYKLPKPKLPKAKMPDSPKLPDDIKDAPHFACDGENYISPAGKDNSGIPDPEPGIPKIIIGIPCLNFSYEFVISFLKFWTEICVQAKGKMQVGYQFMYRKPVHMAEIQLAEIAVFNKCTHLLLMDDDIYDVTLADLQKLIAADKDVVSGIMHASKFPFAECAFRKYDTDKKVIDMPSDNSMFRLYEVPCHCTVCGIGLSHWDAKFCISCGASQDNILQKVDLIPFPFTLIKTSVFGKLKKPWFHCEIEYPSDSWFADRCAEAGIQEWAHMGVRLNHNGVTDLSKPHLFQIELAKKNLEKNKGLVHITEAEMEKHQFLLHNKMVAAEEQLKPKPKMIKVGSKEEQNECKTKSITDGVAKEKRTKVSS